MGICFSCTRKNQRIFLVYFLFVIFILSRVLDTIGVELVRDRTFTLFTLTSCVDNNLLFLTSAEGSTHEIIAQTDFYPLLSQFFSRAENRLLSVIFEFFTALPSIVTILCLSQLILSGTTFRNKCFISKCACL